MITRLSALLACGIMLLTAGCGGEDNGVLVPVSGTVTYNGSPLTKGEIQFIPEQATGARGAQGNIQEDGSYSLSSYGLNDGAHPGKYKVTVIARGPDLPIPKKKKGQMMEEDMQGSGKLLIPKKYGFAAQSGLTADVVAGGGNQFKFDLKD
jgi:hypothetical protein